MSDAGTPLRDANSSSVSGASPSTLLVGLYIAVDEASDVVIFRFVFLKEGVVGIIFNFDIVIDIDYFRGIFLCLNLIERDGVNALFLDFRLFFIVVFI